MLIANITRLLVAPPVPHNCFEVALQVASILPANYAQTFSMILFTTRFGLQAYAVVFHVASVYLRKKGRALAKKGRALGKTRRTKRKEKAIHACNSNHPDDALFQHLCSCRVSTTCWHVYSISNFQVRYS